MKITLSGRSIWAGVWSESKPHLLNKLNYSPWDVPRKAKTRQRANRPLESLVSFIDDLQLTLGPARDSAF